MLSRRKFIKNSLIGLGFVALPLNLIPTKQSVPEDYVQIFVGFCTEINCSDKNYFDRYITPAVARLECEYTKYKSKGYISFDNKKNKKLIPASIDSSYFKYKGMYVRHLKNVYNIEYDEYYDRLDIFMAKFVRHRRYYNGY